MSWRSLLFVPVNVERFVASAARRGADAIQLDLEDSVALSEKESARAKVAAAARTVADGGADVVVRINRPLSLAVRDIEASVVPHVVALTIPKVAGPEHVRLLSELVGELEHARGIAPGTIRFILLLETAAAFVNVDAIATADSRIVAMTLGSEDFATDLGIAPTEDALLAYNTRVVVACRAAKIAPLGVLGSIADFSDLDAYRSMVRRSAQSGFTGARCIHPSQVAILNETFAPTESEVREARRIVEAYDEALRRGVGAIQIEGRMIDVPVADRARAVLSRAEANAARGARVSV